MPKSNLTSDFGKKNILETESVCIKDEPISDNENQMSDVTERNEAIFNVNMLADFETKKHFNEISPIKNEVLTDNEEEGVTYSIKKEILNNYEEKSISNDEDQMSVLEFEKRLYYDLRKGAELSSVEVSDVESEKSDFDNIASFDSDEFSDFEEEERRNLDSEEERGNLDNKNINSDVVTNKKLRLKMSKSPSSENEIIRSDLQVNEDEKHRKYNCCMCSKRFKLKHHLNQHILSHTYTRTKAVRMHKCPTCSKEFKLKHHLERHRLTHSKVKQFKCETCDKSYVAKYDLKKHMTVHLVKTDFKICDICGVNCETDSKLQKHKHTHDKICGICGKEFANHRYLRYHLRVHAKLASFPCDVCGKVFKFKAALVEHSRMHTGEKPYECEVCNQSFSTKSNQIRHTKSHFQTRKCKHCEKEFAEKKEFQQHLKTCNSKYRCDKCDWDFKKTSNYKRHLEIHAKNLNSPSKVPRLTPEAITIETLK